MWREAKPIGVSVRYRHCSLQLLLRHQNKVFRSLEGLLYFYKHKPTRGNKIGSIHGVAKSHC
jgi:hypothetical protein